MNQSHFRHIEGRQLWYIIKRLCPEHDNGYFRYKFFDGNLDRCVDAKRAFEIARLVLGSRGGDVQAYWPQVPLPLKKELEQLFGHTGKAHAPYNMSTQAQAGRLLSREIGILLGARKFKLKQKPEYKGKRIEMVFDMPKLSIAGIKILARYFIVKEWELVTILLAGHTVYTPKVSKRP